MQKVTTTGQAVVALPDVATTGSLAAVSATVTTAVNSQGIVAIQLTGTWVGTITFQGTEDPLGVTAPSTSFFNVNGVASVTGLQVTSTTANGQFRVNAGGYTAVRAIMTVFTSGSATVWMNASLAPSMATLAEPLPTGTNSIGTVGSNSASGAAYPTNIFAIGGKDSINNLVPFQTAGQGDNVNPDRAISLQAYSLNSSGNGDRVRNNTSGAIIAAGATTAQTSTTQISYNAKRLHAVINISAFTSGTLTFTINAITASGYTYPLLTSTALAAVGLTVLRIFDGATPVANLTANDSIPRSFNVVVSGTFVATYGIDFNLGV